MYIKAGREKPDDADLRGGNIGEAKEKGGDKEMENRRIGFGPVVFFRWYVTKRATKDGKKKRSRRGARTSV